MLSPGYGCQWILYHLSFSERFLLSVMLSSSSQRVGCIGIGSGVYYNSTCALALVWKDTEHKLCPAQVSSWPGRAWWFSRFRGHQAGCDSLIHAGSHAGSSTDDGVRGVPKGLDSPMGTTRCRRSPGMMPERVNALARVQGAA